jgi:hypothetical protein
MLSENSHGYNLSSLLDSQEHVIGPCPEPMNPVFAMRMKCYNALTLKRCSRIELIYYT